MTQRTLDLSRPNIVAVIHGSLNQCRHLVQLAEADGADVLELRVDLIDDDPAEVLETVRAASQRPWLITIRHKDEGGEFEGSESKRLVLYQRLLRFADAVDVELHAGSTAAAVLSAAAKSGRLGIASLHRFADTPSAAALLTSQEMAYQAGANVFKAAVTANAPEDVDQLAYVTVQGAAQGLLATVAMGPYGGLARALNPLLGSCLTYGFVGEQAVVPGQVTVGRLRTWLDWAWPQNLSRDDVWALQAAALHQQKLDDARLQAAYERLTAAID